MSDVNPNGMSAKKVIALCKRRAKQIKNDYPENGLCQRMDIAAREMGFKNYNDLRAAAEVKNEN